MSCYVEERLQHRVKPLLVDTLVEVPTLGTSRESGLNRVPLEGPPTYGHSKLQVFLQWCTELTRMTAFVEALVPVVPLAWRVGTLRLMVEVSRVVKICSVVRS